MGWWGKYVICVLFPLLAFSCAKGSGTRRGPSFISTLALTDVFGREFEQSSLAGRFLYLQFINKSNSKREIINTQIIERLVGFNKVISLLVLPESLDHPPTSSPQSNVYFVIDKGQILKREFGAPLCCNGYLIFNPSQVLICADLAHDASYTEAMPYLTELQENVAIEDFGPEYVGKVIEERGIANDIFDLIRAGDQTKKYFIVALISNLCSTCLSGKLFEQLNLHDISDRPALSIHVFLSAEYGEVDLANLRSTRDISVDLQSPPIATLNAWRELKERLPAVFSDIFFVLDDLGKVIFVLDRQEPARFVSYIRKLG
jgi:hypothetical protein